MVNTVEDNFMDDFQDFLDEHPEYKNIDPHVVMERFIIIAGKK